MKNYCESCIHDDDIGFCDKCWYNHLLEERNLPPTEYEEEKKITNYYSLIHKSQEELAHWLVERVTDSPWCKPDAPDDPVTKQCEIWDCEKCALEWLKQEVENADIDN